MSIQNSHQISDVKVMLKVGADGSGIESIEKTGTSGIVDTYTITMTDGTKSTFTVTNGSSIESIEKTSTVGLVDTYTITLTNGDTSTFEVHNASGGGMLAHILITSDAGSTVTVTTPSGDVITATQVTGSTTQWECDTSEYGVHYIDSVLGGEDERVTLTVDTCKVYSIDDSHVHASITVTFPQGFTCRCQGQGENYYSSVSPYTFSVHHIGEYTISASDGTTTYTETVTITSSSQSVTMYCPSVANAPTDDVQLWLMYGDITDKNYTTLSEVLADTTTYSALIADHDAVDYLKRSVGWAINKGLVPVMTSNTTPSGECIASSVHSSQYDIYKAFDGDDSTNWNSSTSDSFGSAYLGYMFTSPIIVSKVRLYTKTWSGGTRISAFKLQGYNGSSWVDIGSEITGRSDGDTSYNFDNSTAYNGYRILITNGTSSTISIGALAVQLLQFYAYTGNGITEDSTAMSILGLNNYASDTLLSDADWLEAICNSQYFESVLNVKVPTMTSDNTPSGEVSSKDYYDVAYPWKAFDGSDSTYYSQGEGTDNNWVQYQFTDNVTVCMAKCLFETTISAIKQRLSQILFKDGNNNVAKTVVVSTLDSSDVKFIMDNLYKSNIFRLETVKNISAGVSFYTIQFYGREDV